MKSLHGQGNNLFLQDCDTVIIKHRVSALYATPLSTILSANQIDTVMIAGVSTNMTVDTTTRELHDRDFNVIILKDACGAATEENHDAALATLSRIAKICDTKQITNIALTKQS